MHQEYSKPPENFYIVVSIHQSVKNNSSLLPLYEENFSLIKAASEDDARAKVAKQNENPVRFENVYGKNVTWTLKEVISAHQLLGDEIAEEQELFGRFFRNYTAYKNTFLNAEEEKE